MNKLRSVVRIRKKDRGRESIHTKEDLMSHMRRRADREHGCPLKMKQ